MGYRNRMPGTWVALLTSAQYIGILLLYFFCLKGKGELFKSKNHSVHLDIIFFKSIRNIHFLIFIKTGNFKSYLSKGKSPNSFILKIKMNHQDIKTFPKFSSGLCYFYLKLRYNIEIKFILNKSMMFVHCFAKLFITIKYSYFSENM